MSIRFAEETQVVPVFAPASSTVDSTESAGINLENAQWVTFLVQFGAMTTDSTDTITVSVVAADSDNASTAAGDTAIPFQYRLSSALGTDAWGAITAGTTAGVTITAAQDNVSLVIDVDPAAVQAYDADADYVYLDFGTPGIISGFASACAFIEPRYPQNSQLTSS